MAQAVGGTAASNNEGKEELEFDLKQHFKKHNVDDKVFNLLQKDSITFDELLTFTNNDLERWCDENRFKTIVKRRFINSIKSIPNSQANKLDFVPVFLGHEEKEQLTQFDDMKNNIKNMINAINDINDKCQDKKIITQINNVCDDIISFVQQLRTNLLKQVVLQYFLLCAFFGIDFNLYSMLV